MRVLSLFDGMSCGQIALNRIGIKPDKYYASEIDKYAIKATQNNFPDTIQLGCIKNWKKWDIGNIDLVIGGSPCQGFSTAGNNREQFKDPRSKLFFDFAQILKKTNPKHFLLENVRMKKEYQDIISNKLGVPPVLLNSALVSGQNRERLYWSNINITPPEDRGIFFKSAYCNNEKVKRIARPLKEKANCISASYYKGLNAFSRPGVAPDEAIGKTYHEAKELGFRMLTPNECEYLQTVPDNYTKGLSNTQRYKMLGNGWTVDIIAHILQGIK